MWHRSDGPKAGCWSTYWSQRKQAPFSIHTVIYQAGQVRTIQDLDLDKLKKKTYDGGVLEPGYDAPVGPKPSVADASKQSYQGSCHCGKVTFTLQSEPLNDLEVTDCNCNICARVSIFPDK